MSLSLLSILLGLGMAVPQVYGIAKPQQFAVAVRKFPRNARLGVVLMLLGTAWFVWNVHLESVSDFASFKPAMMGGFAAIGILCCFFVRDFLAVRGLAVLALLLAKTMVDTGRPHLGQTHWVWVIQAWAYLMVLAGIWLTVAPWRLRDFLQWGTATDARIRVTSTIRLAFAVFIVILGLTAFREM